MKKPAFITLLAALWPLFLSGQITIDELPENELLLRWEGDEASLLQATDDLNPPVWRDLPSTLGTSEWRISRGRQLAFYRVARLTEPDSIRLLTLQQRSLNLVSNVIQQAIHPEILAPDAELPPGRPQSDPRLSTKEGNSSLLAYLWTSQPGLIRNYVESANEFSQAHKLYSSSAPIATTSAQLKTDEQATTNWENQPDRYVDLNKKVGNRFPILDPRAKTIDGVEGFDFTSGDEERLSMPVEWLYTLRDGSLGFLDASGRFQGTGTPSSDNPIESRLAYWTDDESTKVNVNVASEGVPWDIPIRDTPDERIDAFNAPVTNEVQRYPGHPATTCLSSVLFPGLRALSIDPDTNLSKNQLNAIYHLTPGLINSGSKTSTVVRAESPITLDPDAPYPSLDDFMSEATGSTHPFFTEVGEESSDQLERSRGFLT
ncbi:MAG: hypothetical protein AAF514_24820, partial [Verrucomicrobiota bacterium]